MKQLGDTTPQSLLNTVWFNNTVHFGLRGSHEHYNLRWGDVTLCTGSDGVKYLELNERQTKTRTGENHNDVREVTPKIYEFGGPNDPVKMYEIYASKRPADFSGNDDPFYLAPHTIPLEDTRSARWYLKQKVGERKLSSIVKTMKEKTNLNKDKRLTNHSARKYLVNKLRTNNIEGTDIMQVSGHKNVASVLNYSAISENKQKEMSNILSNTDLSAVQPVDLPRVSASAPGNTHFTRPNTASFADCGPQFCSQTQSNQLVQSMFYGATLQIGTMNVYMRPPAQ